MKRSSAVALSIVPLLAACNNALPPSLDPCAPQNYIAQTCEVAVQQQGYFYNGLWYAHPYYYPVSFYQHSYVGYVANGGRVSVVPSSAFSGAAAIGTGTVRGGFGSSGAAHASASAGE